VVRNNVGGKKRVLLPSFNLGLKPLLRVEKVVQRGREGHKDGEKRI